MRLPRVGRRHVPIRQLCRCHLGALRGSELSRTVFLCGHEPARGVKRGLVRVEGRGEGRLEVAHAAQGGAMLPY